MVGVNNGSLKSTNTIENLLSNQCLLSINYFEFNFKIYLPSLSFNGGTLFSESNTIAPAG